jgi:hypothetical protein
MELSELSMNLTDMLLPWIAILVSVIITIWFKDFATNFAKGLAFKRKPGFEPGDRVYLDGEKALIISIGIQETVFELERDGITVWRYVPNTRTEYIKLEKIIEE